MILFLAFLVVLLAVVVILRGAEVRLTLILAALLLGALAGQPVKIVQTFLDYFTREQFLLPIGCCMGFAFVLRHTGCDQHLVHLLVRPLQRVRAILVPGVVLIGTVVNVPIISQSSTAVAVGSVLVPVLVAARVSPTTVGAALALGSSIGGELLNPGAPELRTVSKVCKEHHLQVDSIDCVQHVWPLLLVHLLVTVPLFWLLCQRAEATWKTEEEQPLADDFRVNPIKAFVPLVPLLLLFVISILRRLPNLDIPETWLVPDGKGSFDSRLIGAAMLIGVVVAALTTPGKAKETAKVFFEGGGYALANITSLIIAAGCLGKGVELVGLAAPLQQAIRSAPQLLVPLAAALPLGFGWVSGSGMASTESLFGFYIVPALNLDVEPLRIGAVVSLAAATGRTLSPVSAVVLMAASLTGASPLAMVRRMALPMLLGLCAVVVAALFR